jgi:hypothetical protein
MRPSSDDIWYDDAVSLRNDDLRCGDEYDGCETLH